jgi:hypothetical protein
VGMSMYLFQFIHVKLHAAPCGALTPNGLQTVVDLCGKDGEDEGKEKVNNPNPSAQKVARRGSGTEKRPQSRRAPILLDCGASRP